MSGAGCKAVPSRDISRAFIEAQLEKVQAGEKFARSPEISKLLRYLVKQTLDRPGEQLTETVVGLELYGSDFDPLTDKRVRTYASRLRERLKNYYETDGRNDLLLIQIPIGGYTAEFRLVEGPVAEPQPLKKVEEKTVPSPLPKRWNWKLPTLAAAFLIAVVAVLLLLRVPNDKHIAVLPFTTTGYDQKCAVCDGLLNDLVSKLAQMENYRKDFWVVPMDVVRELNIRSAREARKALGVNMVITGNVQQSGEWLHINLALENAIKEVTLRTWGPHDIRVAEISRLRDEIIGQIAEMLELELRPEMRRVLAAGDSTVPGALGFYLSGLGYLERGRESTDQAIGLFDRALELDPRYALAHARLADAYLQKFYITRDAEWLKKARVSCERAIEINKDLAPVHNTMGLIYHTTGQDQRAVDEYKESLRLDGRNAIAFVGLALAYQTLRQLNDAEKMFQAAIDLRPGYWASHTDLGLFYVRYGRYKEGELHLQRAVELAPDNVGTYNNLGLLYIKTGQLTEAERTLKKSLSIKRSVEALDNLGVVYFHLGRYDEAVRAFRQAIDVGGDNMTSQGNLAEALRWSPQHANEAPAAYRHAIQLAEKELAINPNNAPSRAMLALFFARIGETKRALAEIRQSVQLAPQNGTVLLLSISVYERLGLRDESLGVLRILVQGEYSIAEIRRDPDLADLRRDPLYVQLVSGRP